MRGLVIEEFGIIQISRIIGMTKTQLYLRLYMRFVKLYNLMPIKEALRDIAHANRLIYGIGIKYHPTHRNEWIDLVAPFFLQDIDFMLDKMRLKTNKKQDINELVYNMKYSNFMIYLNKLGCTNISIIDFFNAYDYAMRQKVKFNHKK